MTTPADADPAPGAGVAPRSGAQQFVEFLEQRDQRHVFGLTGSSSVSIFHQLQRSKVEYVQAVHESAAIAMADGYARVTGAGTAVIYKLPGTGNAVNNIYNAWRDENPLLVIASQQRSNLRTGTSSTGEADLLPLVKQFTKFAAEIPAGSSLEWWLEAATQRAYGPPSGPSFLSIPVDVLEDAAVASVDRERSVRSS